MIRIAITPYDIIDHEADIITRLLQSDWDYVHLRHPDASITDMRNIIERIPQSLHSRLKLHGYFELTNQFNLGGLHLNSRCPSAPPLYRGSLSRSCHTPDEVRNAKGYDYVTFSPVFPSISKPEYKPAYTELEIAEMLKQSSTPVIALGGVTMQMIPRIENMGFAGYAMLGAIWQNNNANDSFNILHSI